MVEGRKTAIVTGAAIRLGKAIALALAEDGFQVGVHYGSSEEAAHETISEIERLGVTAIPLHADLTSPVAAAESIFHRATSEFGRVDLLVNCAAIFESGGLLATSADLWDRHFDINLKAPAFLSREFARQFSNRDSSDTCGQIIHLVDRRVFRADLTHFAYNLTKAALAEMTKILAQELAPGIRVNAIAPGAILPPPDESEDYLKKVSNGIPLKRSGGPEDVVQAVRYLVEAEFVTGEILTVTGGEHL